MPANKRYGFGFRAQIPEGAEESRIIPFVLSTLDRDRHGTVLNQDNWNIDNYRLNPVVAYQHTLSGGLCTDPDPDYIIGKSISIGVEGLGIDRRLVASAQFEPSDINPLAEKVFRKVLFGSLSRSSVGFLEIGQGKYGTGEEAEGRSEETYYFAGQELLEWSVVNIPSNPQAGKRDIAMRRMREEGFTALMYAYRELGGRFTLSQIESYSVRDIFDLLDGKDLEIRERNPEKIRAMLAENTALKDQVARLQAVLRMK